MWSNITRNASGSRLLRILYRPVAGPISTISVTGPSMSNPPSLALGLPVVTTYYPEVEGFCHVVSVPGSRDEFIEMVRGAPLDGESADPKRRRSAVLDAGWDRIVARIVEVGHVASRELS